MSLISVGVATRQALTRKGACRQISPLVCAPGGRIYRAEWGGLMHAAALYGRDSSWPEDCDGRGWRALVPMPNPITLLQAIPPRGAAVAVNEAATGFAFMLDSLAPGPDVLPAAAGVEPRAWPGTNLAGASLEGMAQAPGQAGVQTPRAALVAAPAQAGPRIAPKITPENDDGAVPPPAAPGVGDGAVPAPTVPPAPPAPEAGAQPARPPASTDPRAEPVPLRRRAGLMEPPDARHGIVPVKADADPAPTAEPGQVAAGGSASAMTTLNDSAASAADHAALSLGDHPQGSGALPASPVSGHDQGGWREGMPPPEQPDSAAPAATGGAAPIMPAPITSPPITSPPAAMAAQDAPAIQPAHPAEQLAPVLVSIARDPGGARHIALVLQPDSLGRLQIQIDHAPGAVLQIRVTAERAETLALLQRDTPQLQHALDRAGVPREAMALSFHATPTIAAPAEAGGAAAQFMGMGQPQQGPAHGMAHRPPRGGPEPEPDHAPPMPARRAGLGSIDITA